jgi:hypothetical protein
LNDVRIFDENGNFVDRSDDELKVGQTVRVRGWLTPTAQDAYDTGDFEGAKNLLEEHISPCPLD